MKKKPNWFLRLVFISFLIFMGLYIVSISGYQAKRINDKVILTEEAIKEFEADILAGKEVDIKSYLQNDYVDYSNMWTKAGDKVTDAVQSLLVNGFTNIWDVFKVLFL